MSRVAAALLWLAMWLVAAPLSAQLTAPGDADDAFRVDARGREFRVRFPPHDRLWMQGGGHFGLQSSPTIAAGLKLSLDVPFPEEEIWWQLRHDIAGVEFRAAPAPSVVLRGLDGDYLRHDVSSTILIPRGERDIRLPAPFDIAVVWSLVTVELRPGQAEVVGDVEVVDLAVLADFVRDEQYRHRLALGVVASYDAMRREGVWEHRVGPFAAGTALWGWEHRSGRAAVLVRGTMARLATIRVAEPVAWVWRGTTAAEVEWAPLAVNNAPISLVGDVQLAHDFGGETTWTAGLGARLSFPLGI